METKKVFKIGDYELISFKRYPCMFFRLRSEECALPRYGEGEKISETIWTMIESIRRGLLLYEEKDVRLSDGQYKKVFDEVVSFLRDGQNKTVVKTLCMGLYLTNEGYFCPVQSILFTERLSELLFLLGSPDERGCLCYIARAIEMYGTKMNY